MTKLKFLLLGTAIVVFATILLLPRQVDFDRIEALYNRGQLDAARAGLEQALKKQPDWHEARELLFQIEIESGRPLAALKHLAPLPEGSIELHQHLDEIWNSITCPGCSQCASDVEYLNFCATDWGQAWQLALTLSESFSNPGSGFQYILLQGLDKDPERWSQLQQQFPEESLIALGLAQAMPQPQGLDWLAEWEARHQGEVNGYYGYLKTQILMGVEIKQTHLGFISPEDLLFLALNTQDEGSKSLLIGELEHRGEEELLELAQLATIQPTSRHTWDSFGSVQLTEGGGNIVSYSTEGAGGVVIYDIADGSSYTLPDLGMSYFSPDGNLVAIPAPASVGSVARLWDNKGNYITEVSLESRVDFIGWRDSESLWVTQTELDLTVGGNVTRLNAVNLDGTMARVEGIPDQQRHLRYYPGPEGRIAWQSGAELSVWDGERLSTFPLDEQFGRLSWRPDGKGLILSSGEIYYLDLATGTLDALMPESEESWRAVFRGWKNADEVHLDYLMGIGNLRMLANYNLHSQELKFTGILNSSQASGNTVLVDSNDGTVEIYILE